MSRILPGIALRARWRPTPVVASSIGWHCLVSAGAIVRPELWTWALGAIAANHAILSAAGMWPGSTWLGPNLSRLPEPSRVRREFAITIDDGPDPEVTPPILDLLDRRGARATFFCIGDRARANPELCREIAKRGHAVENHTGRHLMYFPFLGIAGQRKEILSAQAVLTELSGTVPRFFRPPAGIRSPLLDPVLCEAGLQLATWTRRAFDTQSKNAERVSSRLTCNLAAGDILLLHDGNAARAASGRPVILESLPRVLDEAEARGLRAVTLRHAVDS